MAAPKLISAFARYGVALLATAAGFLLSNSLFIYEGVRRSPFVVLLVAVAVTAWYGGTRPALVAMGLSALSALWLLGSVPHVPGLDSGDVIEIVEFITLALVITLLHAQRGRARHLAGEHERWLHHTLESIGDGVIATDHRGRIAFMNGVAESLTGWRREAATGRLIAEVIRLVDDATRAPLRTDASGLLAREVAQPPAHAVLIAANGTERIVDPGISPIRDDDGLQGVILVFRDVTERVQAAQDLARQEERLRLALDAAQMGTWSYDPRSGRLDWSSRVEVAHGLAPGTFGRTVEGFLERVHPDDRPRVTHEIQDAVAGEAGIDVEYRTVRPDRGIRWIAAKGRIVHDERGRVTCVGVGLDIDAQKRAEAALRESETRFRVVADTAPVMIWMSDAERRCTFVNRHVLDFTGVTADEEFGAGWAARVHPDDLAGCLAVKELHFEARKPFRMEYRLQRADGVYRSILDTGVPRFESDGLFAGFIGSCVDVTDYRLAQDERERLLAREQSARAHAEAAEWRSAFVANASEALASSLDYEATVLSIARLAVPAFADAVLADLVISHDSLLGGSTGTVVRRVALGRTDPAGTSRSWDIERLDDPSGSSLCGLAKAIESGLPELCMEVDDAFVRELARDSEHLDVFRSWGLRSVLCVPLVARGRTLGAICLAYGEPSGRRYTAVDLGLAEDVGRRMALAVDNARLYQAAETANRAKDEFLTMLSHELRTPLNAIAGWAHLLRSGRLDDAARARAFETIERNTRTQTRLIDDLLDVSRIVTGRLRIELRPLQLAVVVDAAIDVVRPAAEARELTVDCHIDRDVGPVWGDSNRLQQVVWNLLSNAIKFTPQGGLVEVRLGRDGGNAHISVRDTGKGIRPDFVPYVFDRFRQADSTSARAHGGLGIGLAIVRHLVELHGGTVRAESDGEGQGATFHVELPVRQMGAVAAPSDARPHRAGPDLARMAGSEGTRLSGIQVLLVEDEADARDLFTTLLRECGADVHAVPSVPDALTALHRAWPDVLVTDLAMPGQDGFALLRQVKALEAERGVRLPAVALTAYARDEDRVISLRAGFERHIPKPVDPAELAEAVGSVAHRPT